MSSEVGAQKYIKLFGGSVDYWKNIDLETIVKGKLVKNSRKSRCEKCNITYLLVTKNNGYNYIMCKCGIFHDGEQFPRNKYYTK
jgi:hypothetical protein